MMTSQIVIIIKTFIMKYLLLVRHAEPHLNIMGQNDIDRSLNIKGECDAKIMAQKLDNKGYIPDIIISSHANRAISTCKIIAKILNYPSENIRINKNIYYSSIEEVIGVIKNVPQKYNFLMLTGHNPTLHYLSQALTGDTILSFDTCMMFCIQFDIEHWDRMKIGKIKFNIYPKLFK